MKANSHVGILKQFSSDDGFFFCLRLIQLRLAAMRILRRHNFVVRDERLKIKYSQEPKKASMQQPGLVPFDKSIRSSMFDESPDALAIRGGRRGNENFRSAFMRFSPRAISFVSTDDATLCASVLS